MSTLPVQASIMPKVAHLVKMTGVAGTEHHLLDLLPGLRQRGIDAHLFIMNEPHKPMDEYIKHMNELGVPAESLPVRFDFDPAVISALQSKLRAGKFDLLHTHLIHADVHGLLAGKLAGIRHFVSSGHNDDAFRKLMPIRVFQGWFWRQVQAGIAISEALRQFMIHMEFAPAQKIHTVHYGFNLNSMPPAADIYTQLRVALNLPPTVRLVGSVGRLVPQKGFVYGLMAFRRIAEQFPDAHYVIIGDGPLREQLHKEVKAAELEERVHFLGWRTDARQLFHAFDVFLMPSLWEGFGLVALEAMAAGVPIVASRVTAIPEIVVQGTTGYLTSPADVNDISERLHGLLRNTAHAQMMGQAGRQRLETFFSVPRMLDGTLAVYNEVLGHEVKA